MRQATFGLAGWADPVLRHDFYAFVQKVFGTRRSARNSLPAVAWTAFRFCSRYARQHVREVNHVLLLYGTVEVAGNRQRECRRRGQASASEFIHQGSLCSFALTFSAEHGRSAKRSHITAICTNAVLSCGVLTD
jgi:hypothetical protein